MASFNTEAMKLGALGVTVTVSSGDDGVAADEQLCNEPSGSADYGDWTVRKRCHSFLFFIPVLWLPNLAHFVPLGHCLDWQGLLPLIPRYLSLRHCCGSHDGP